MLTLTANCVYFSPECFPIRIPISDPFYPSSKTCMNFVRSLGGIDNNCGLGKIYSHHPLVIPENQLPIDFNAFSAL